ncbi:aldose epimerase family protein [Streptomyces fulvorobeus]|uniref:Aldose 1-epimerase n=1 Tax=Streptomyces fulvorobeus TaxID=284028 RepID=A0A7J0CEB0_9ACTN|nr:aldose epimerase family protein [Streptomyces fulvorobeus]NYE44321.1 aldose 1-epimerase [Streptomyces fulvorobeus]GFN00843.1 aldose 1-epimerase [Streptomyces fulvorobeus]
MPRPTVYRTPFGSADGTPVHRWSLDCGTGVRAEVLTYGASLHSLTVPDTKGATASVVRSLATVDDYTAKHPYFGAVVGRYANRIANGRFTLDGTTHHIPANDRGHALHGGPEGFHTKVWDASAEHTDDTASVRLTLHSPDGDMGFPGALDCTVTYTLDAAGTLAIDYASVSDRPTHVNLTSHAYFDLAGHDDVLGHRLEVDADTYVPVDGDGIPLGPPAEVRGTPFDLTGPRLLGERLGQDDEQLRTAGGFDHSWVLRGPDGLRRAARLTGPRAARVLEVWTTEPGIQVYTANRLDGSFTDATGRRHERHGSICLETQHLPDSPNRPYFPSTVLRPGDTARSRTELRFPHLLPRLGN